MQAPDVLVGAHRAERPASDDGPLLAPLTPVPRPVNEALTAMAADFWTWHPQAGKPWMQEKAVVEARQQEHAVGAGASPSAGGGFAPPIEEADAARLLLRLYCTVDADDQETMDAREYCVFCVDHADVCEAYLHKVSIAHEKGGRTDAEYAAARQQSRAASLRCIAAEAYVQDPAANPEGAPPPLDALLAEFETDPEGCPGRMRRLLEYVGHARDGRRKLESRVGTPQPPWSLHWSSEHRLWFWHRSADGSLLGGGPRSTWLRPIPPGATRRAEQRRARLLKELRSKLEPMLSDHGASWADAAGALGHVTTSRDLQAGVDDPGLFLKEQLLGKGGMVGTGAAAPWADAVKEKSALRKGRVSSNTAVSVVLGYDYRLLPNQPREYFGGTEEKPLTSPAGLALDAPGNRLFVSESHRIRMVQLHGDDSAFGWEHHVHGWETHVDGDNAEVIAGFNGVDIGFSSGFTDGTGTAARFASPSAMAYDAAAHRLYVADTGNHAVRVLDERPDGKWQVSTVAGTGKPDGFGGPSVEFGGRASVHDVVGALVTKVKEVAMLPLGQKMLLPPEELGLLSKTRTTEFGWVALEGGGAAGEPEQEEQGEGEQEPAVEWRASISPLFKEESLPPIEEVVMLPPQVRGTIPSLAERSVASHDGSVKRDIATMTKDEVQIPLKVCIEIRAGRGLAAGSKAAFSGDERGHAAIVTVGVGAAKLTGADGSGEGSDGLQLLRLRMLEKDHAGFAGWTDVATDTGCKRCCTVLSAGPTPTWNERLEVEIPHVEDGEPAFEIIVDVWSGAALCAPQALALSPATWPQPQGLQVGDAVQIKQGGKWLDAEVNEVGRDGGLQETVKLGPWTKTDLDRLVYLVETHGVGDWEAKTIALGGRRRSARAVEQKYYLVTREGYSPDQQILEYMERSVVASVLNIPAVIVEDGALGATFGVNPDNGTISVVEVLRGSVAYHIAGFRVGMTVMAVGGTPPATVKDVEEALAGPRPLFLTLRSPDSKLELLVGCGGTREAADTHAAHEELASCEKKIALLSAEQASLQNCISKPELSDDERLRLQNRSVEIGLELKLLAQRSRRAIARGTAAHSIRLLETPRYAPGALGCSVRGGKRVAAEGFTVRSVVKGGGKLKDPCSIVLEPHPSQRHYVVAEGSTQRLVSLLPNGYSRPLGLSNEQPSGICMTPSGASMFLVDTSVQRRGGGLEELGRLREATVRWEWGEEKFTPSRVKWHAFEKADQLTIEELFRSYSRGKLAGEAHIAQFTMAKDRVEEIENINVFRNAVAFLQQQNKLRASRPVPTEPILHLMRQYGTVKPSERGRLIDFETMRAAIDSMVRRPITQYTRVVTRTADISARKTGLPDADPLTGKQRGRFGEWVTVTWDDDQRDAQVIGLILGNAKLQGKEELEKKQLELKSVNPKQLKEAAMVLGVDRRRLDEIYSFRPLYSKPMETSSLKLLMSAEDTANQAREQAGAALKLLLDAEEQAGRGSAGPGSARPTRVQHDIVAGIPTPIERWLLKTQIPWMKPLMAELTDGSGATVLKSSKELKALAQAMQTRVYQPGHVIMEEGKGGNLDRMALFILTKGTAKATARVPSNGRERYPTLETVKEYGPEPGSTFGELAILASDENYARATSVIAETKCTVLVVSRAAFEQCVESDMECMRRLRERQPEEYWGEYWETVKSQPKNTREKKKKKQVRNALAVRTALRKHKAGEIPEAPEESKKVASKMWTSGPGGGGPVTALPTDLLWRELRRADTCTLSIVDGGIDLPLRDPRAIVALDERTLLIADRWIDEISSVETGCIWKIDLDKLKLAGDLKATADQMLATRFYRKALDGYTACDALFARNEVVRMLMIKTTGLLRKFGPEPGAGPSPSEDGGE